MLLIGILLGGFAAWYITKLRFEQSNVPTSEVEQLQNEANSLKTNLTVETERVNLLNKNLEKTERSLSDANLKINELTGNLSAEAKSCESLKKQLSQSNEEIKSLRQTVEEKREEIGDLNRTMATNKAELDSAKKSLKSAEETITTNSEDIKVRGDEIMQLSKQASTLLAERNSLEEKLATLKTEIEEIRKTSELVFKNVASQILEEKSSKFTELNSTNLQNLLGPLGEHIDSFKKRVEEVYDKESKERFSLGREVEKLVLSTQKISEDANNLTKALEGSSKAQGDWGEMILERILEKSGLVKNREYFIQEYLKDDDGSVLKNDDGTKMQPDVTILYPDNRRVIIDSKVSLVAYKQLVNSNENVVQEISLKNHIRSLRNHVDQLSRKNYQDFARSLDFVMMFVPIEPAYLIATHNDEELWSYAYNKRVLLTTPTNLIAILKVIEDLWKREYQSKNALQIAQRGGQMYDKFVSFVETLLDIGENIAKAQKSYDKAVVHLKNGRGNLITQAEKMRELGAKAKKTLPSDLINDVHDTLELLPDDIQPINPGTNRDDPSFAQEEEK